MFKNYLSYQFAVGFERAVATLGASGKLEQSVKNELMSCVRNMLQNFGRSLYVKDKKDRAKSLFVAVMYLRDCRELILKATGGMGDLQGPYDVLHGRLEQLCLDASEAEQGQLRMLG